MKIICIGQNYAEHAREMNSEIPSEPVIFLKPETALLPKGHPFMYPEHSQDLHYEVELVLRIDKLGKHIEPQFAHKYYSHVGIGIDFTARDVQQTCKKKGLPWEKAKAFDHSAPLGATFLDISSLRDSRNIEFELLKNGKVVQQGKSSEMIFDFDSIISHVSRYFTLKMGDLIFTGTPSGVGPVVVGDVLEASIEGQNLLKFSVK